MNQIGQHNPNNDNKETCIDLQSALENLQEIKKGCLERSGSVRADNSQRRNVMFEVTNAIVVLIGMFFYLFAVCQSY